MRAFGCDVDLQDAGVALDDRLQVGNRVVVEPSDVAEAVAQRAGDEPGPGGGPDEGEAGEVETQAAGARTLAEDDVELEVFHRRVQHLFDDTGQPVDLIDEQHVVLGQVREDRRQVAGPLEGRAGRDPEADAHLGRDDRGKRGLP